MKLRYLWIGLIPFLGCREITWKTETIVHADGTTDRNLTLLTNIEYDSLRMYFRLPSETDGWRWEKTKNIDASREKKKDVYNLKIEKFHKEKPFTIPADFHFQNWRDTTVHAENTIETSAINYIFFKDYSFREIFTSTSPKDTIQSALNALAKIYSDAWLNPLSSGMKIPDSLQKEIRLETKKYLIHEISKSDTVDIKRGFADQLVGMFQKHGVTVSKNLISSALDSADKILNKSDAKKTEKITDRFTALLQKYRGGIESINFEQVLDLPGSIRSTNGTLLVDNRIQWKFSADNYIIADYVMEARSRKIQWHIILIGLILVYWGVRKLKVKSQK
jgi:hypothetical protein